MSQLLLTILLVAFATENVNGLRLVAAPLLGISPAMDIMGVAAQLQGRGHQVLVVVTESAVDFVKSAAARHSSNTTAEALEYLVVNITWREFAPPKPRGLGEVPPPSRFAIPDERPESLAFKVTAGFDMLQLFQPGVAVMASQLLGNTTLMKRLREFNADGLMSVGLSIGSVVSDNTGCLLAHALDVPMLDVSGNTFFSGPPSAPQFGTGITPADLKTPKGLALNLATWGFNTLMTFVMGLVPGATDKLREQFGLPWASSQSRLANGVRRLRGVRSRSCAPLKGIMLSSWLVEYPRSLAAHQVMVGPGSPRPAHAITSSDVADFVNSADAGVVLVAFGTVYGPTLRHEDLLELSQGFAALAPTRVLWPLKETALPPGLHLSDLPLGLNTKVVPWVDYNDVLGHPHTRAFVSHCGLHSVNEVAYHGVPLVAIPFQFEQAEHALKLASRGAGIISQQAPAFRKGSSQAQAMHFTREHITEIIQEVMSNPSYADAAAGIAKALQTYAARRHPYERAADEIELALYTKQVQQAPAAPTTCAVADGEQESPLLSHEEPAQGSEEQQEL